MHCLYMSKTHTHTHRRARVQNEHVCTAIIVNHVARSYSQPAIVQRKVSGGAFRLEPPARTCTDIDVEMKRRRK